MTSPKKVKMDGEVEVMQVAKLTDKAIIPTKVPNHELIKTD